VSDHIEQKLAAHSITISEMFEMLANNPKWVPNKKNRTADWKAIGHTDGGRLISIRFNFDQTRNALEAITGFGISKEEQARYT
jgi:uncharacterized DUF497 family protein